MTKEQKAAYDREYNQRPGVKKRKSANAKMWNDVHHARHLSLQLRGINDELGSYIK